MPVVQPTGQATARTQDCARKHDAQTRRKTILEESETRSQEHTVHKITEHFREIQMK